MSAHSEFVSELTTDILDGVSDQQWDSVKADLTVLSEQIVQALVDRRDHDIRQTYGFVERGFSVLAAKFRVDDAIADARSVALELRAFTRLLGIALQYRKPPDFRQTALDAKFKGVLEKLYAAPSGLSGRELATQLKAREETIARKLPWLRSAGLVRSEPVGRWTINRLTPEARTFMDREHAKDEMPQLGEVAARLRAALAEAEEIAHHEPNLTPESTKELALELAGAPVVRNQPARAARAAHSRKQSQQSR